MSSPRRPGRPAVGGVDTREAILEAARSQFAARGFDGASLRSIAKDAGVTVALVSHYFGDKARLLVAALALPINPLERIDEVVAAGPDGLGDRLTRAFLGAWDPHRDVFAAMVRTSLAGAPVGAGPARAAQSGPPAMIDFAQSVLADRLAAVLDGPTAARRAALISAQMVGLGVMRYVARAPALADLPVDAVAAVYGPAIQAVVDAASPVSSRRPHR